ncbi:hypothetical protein CSC67_07785 [Pusillimonas caeni]|uniref:hypothetical protein n=1 Tax=Pusillimonas caeni TaxID=1348472 RepID=UPI000E59C537|nr:hypothetical protein [Pusillimonas caeni]TFL14061.1 hypothetical protein CSC67_07785 [Pusillimonas caeni]
MTTDFEDFKRALEYLALIEPDPDTCEDYDLAVAPYIERIEEAHAVIRAYGQYLAPSGLGLMQFQLYEVLFAQTDAGAASIMKTAVNTLWDGVGEWNK